jgi:hypothetical protein
MNRQASQPGVQATLPAIEESLGEIDTFLEEEQAALAMGSVERLAELEVKRRAAEAAIDRLAVAVGALAAGGVGEASGAGVRDCLDARIAELVARGQANCAGAERLRQGLLDAARLLAIMRRGYRTRAAPRGALVDREG